MEQLNLIKVYNKSGNIILSNWTDKESRLKIEFPIWFKRFIDIFDKCLICNLIRIYSPLSETGKAYLNRVDDFFSCLEINDALLTNKEYIPFREKLIPFADTINGDVLFWKKDKPNEIVIFVCNENKFIDTKLDIFDLLLNSNNLLIDINYYSSDWMVDFLIEYNFKAKFIEFFSKVGMADINKTKDLLISKFKFKFKHKISKPSFTQQVDLFDAKKNDNCAIEITLHDDSRVGVVIVYPIEMYNQMFEIINEIEKLNLYIVDSGQYNAML